MGINHITLIGRVEKAPELRYTPNGVPLINMRIAVTRPPREGSSGNEVTDYFNVVAWRKLAEQAAESLKKGSLVSVEGRLLTRTHETPDGQRRKVVEVEAQALETLQAGISDGGPAQAGQSGASRAAEAEEPPYMNDVPDVAFSEADEIPF